jgi:hypothetical protein
MKIISGALSGDALNGGSGNGNVAAAAPAVVDFQSGEVLGSTDSGPMAEAT